MPTFRVVLSTALSLALVIKVAQCYHNGKLNEVLFTSEGKYGRITATEYGVHLTSPLFVSLYSLRVQFFRYSIVSHIMLRTLAFSLISVFG
jgi:hypothetical protein